MDPRVGAAARHLCHGVAGVLRARQDCDPLIAVDEK